MATPPLRLGYGSADRPSLRRVGALDPGAAPPPLGYGSPRAELVDWDGDGLPDLLEIGTRGRTRLWPNLGELTWGRPRAVADLPGYGSGTAAIAFADLDGDGAADLVRADVPIAGYVPRDPGRGFQRPVSWRSAPAPAPSAPTVRMADLDGDGVVDLLSSSPTGLAIYYRRDPAGWASHPEIIPKATAPVADLADPHVFVADMTGDGSPDLVRVDGGGVTYWPYLGEGQWDGPVVMTNPPAIGNRLVPGRTFLIDLDGDGCADLLQLDGDRVRCWINRSGSAFGSALDIGPVPTARMSQIRVADLSGTGLPGIVWSMPAGATTGAAYFYLAPLGDQAPYLLNTIENGIGLRTRITYSTSAKEAARDRRGGRPWPHRLPVVVPVVARLETTDASTHTRAVDTYRYSDGRWDGALREFAGFGRVEHDQIGDAVAPTLRVRSRFSTGVDPLTGTEPRDAVERERLRALRGQLLREERLSPDASAVAEFPFDTVEQTWRIDDDGPVVVPRLIASVKSTHERTAAALAVLRTETRSFDSSGNATESVQTTTQTADPVATRTLRTLTAYAADPTGRFLSRAWRVTQFDGAGARIADTITRYDDAAEGSVGQRGLVTARSALVLTDALATEVYGATTLPDFAALGYHRRAGEDGWWVDQAKYVRTESPNGLVGQVIGPRAEINAFQFDASGCHPAALVDPMGNTVHAEFDHRTNRVVKILDASGSTFSATYDPLARLTAVVDPGDSTALPTRLHEYDLTQLPATTTVRQRAESGAPATIAVRERWDGSGRQLERRVPDAAGEVIMSARRYSARGFVATEHMPMRATGAPWTSPDPATPHTEFSYDALGRLIATVNPDGSRRSRAVIGLMVEESDEEDLRPGGAHVATPTRSFYDATGRVVRIEQNLAGRTVASTYTYDLKGDLIEHVDALGRRVRIWHDFLGRTIRSDRPEQSTRSVFDAAGNAVEARSQAGVLAVREFDRRNRPVAVRASAAAAPLARFTYHDTGGPAPADAGLHTVGGRCVRIDDEAGTTILDYDERGRVSSKRWTPTDGGTAYEINIAHRADGQIAGLTYPGAEPRFRATYQYDTAGRLQQVGGVVSALEYDLSGRRTRVRYLNGTEQHYDYYSSGRLHSLELTSPTGVLRSQILGYDLVGNVTSIASPEPALSATYRYDDAYRLIEAKSGSGPEWTYRYDDAGALSFKSDVGDYQYGESGAPSTCLTSAGTDHFAYGGLGEMTSAPWGQQTFDSLGRLVRIEAPAGALTFTYDYAGNRVGAVGGGHTRLTPDPVLAIEDGQTVIYLHDGIGIAGKRLPSGESFFFHPDHLGGLAAVTDGTGTLVSRLAYDPYGSILERTGGGSLENIGYTGGAPEAQTGLLYLGARWYAPRLGIFLSPDPIVQAVYDPLSWSPYAYCRGNPVSFTDPTGRGFWGIFLAALAIVALVVVTILSFGTLTPATGVAIGVIVAGLIAGGVIGGIAAYQKGGSAEDIFEGVLVGAAVGGWAAFLTVVAGGAGAGVAGALHVGGFWGAVIAGAVNGAITGAALGFAAGFAGGRGTLDEIFTKMWQGALVGLIAGAVIGGVAYAISPPTTTLREDLVQGLKPPATPQPAPGTVPGPATGVGAPPIIGDPAEAAGYVGTHLVTHVATPFLTHAAAAILTSSFAPLAEAIVVDAAVGTWDLGYAQKLLETGLVKFGGTW